MSGEHDDLSPNLQEAYRLWTQQAERYRQLRAQKPDDPSPIQKWRTAAKISQAELARRIGVDRTTVVAWEHGVNQPRLSYQLAERLAAALSLPEKCVWEALCTAHFGPRPAWLD